jgi:hypothetical protein
MRPFDTSTGSAELEINISCQVKNNLYGRFDRGGEVN